MFDTYAGLAELGWTPFFHAQYLELAEQAPPDALGAPERIATERRGEYSLLSAQGTRRAVLAGRLRHELPRAAQPCVGDWVLAVAPDDGLARVEHVFARTTLFARRAVDGSSLAQPIAANVDRVIVVAAFGSEDADGHALRRGLNLRRIERYLAAIAQARAQPLVVINKADLRSDALEQAQELGSQLSGVEVLAASAATQSGVGELVSRIGAGETAALVGSSGVGKSSLLNALLGRGAQRVHAMRDADARGRHTTTGRELFRLPGGGVLIDTPGMRELGLSGDAPPPAADDLDQEIAELSHDCRFRDCSHRAEPGCAVRRALATGRLDPERLEHRQKLERELEHQRARSDARARRELRQRARALSRSIRSSSKRSEE